MKIAIFYVFLISHPKDLKDVADSSGSFVILRVLDKDTDPRLS